MYRLGLDIGTTSVGWCVLNTDISGEPNRIISLGARVFDAAEHPKTGASLAAPRRMARGARRTGRRRKHRLHRIKSLLQREGVISKEEMEKLYDRQKNSVPLTDIYRIRSEALERLLDRQELARLLIHLAQRRGFKSNRKNEDAKSDEGKLLSATAENALYMAEKGYLTVGQMLYKDEKYSAAKRNKGGDYSNTFLRSQILEEINIIFQKQKEFGSIIATDSLKEKYIQIFSSQRSFDEGPGFPSPYGGNQIENMVGECTLEKGEKRAAKACYSFEYFDLLQKTNNLRIYSANGQRPLTSEEREKIISLCHKSEKVTYERIRKELNLAEEEFFSAINYSEEDKAKTEKAVFRGMPAYHEMRKAFDKINKGYIVGVTTEKRDAIGTALTYYKTSEKVMEYLSEFDFTQQELEAIGGMKNFSKFGHISLKALKKIIPYMEKGMIYNEACRRAGYDFRAHSSVDKSKYLPKLPDDNNEITSPVVKRAVNQTIKVINAIVKQYGAPAVINIETARELSKDFSERKQIENQQEENRKNNQQVYEEIKNTFHILKPSGQDIIKYRLWQEQQGICLYTNTPIKAENLFAPGYCEIDHIIPYSISFDDSYNNKVLVMAYANREKGNRIPMDYVKSKEDFTGLVKTFIRNRNKRLKLLKEKLTEEDMNRLKPRALQDTKFISRFLSNYIRDSLEFDESYTGKQKVICVNGSVTAYMRKRWGISKIRGNGDMHHAVDAAVIGCISQGTIKKVTEYSRYMETRYMYRDQKVIDAKFPPPWDTFRTEIDIRTSKDPQALLKDIVLPNYRDVDIRSIKPVFVSRMERKKKTGQAHEETVRAERFICEDGKSKKVAVTKTRLQNLKLDKEGEISGYYNPDSDRLLYEMLKERLVQAGGNGKKAFPEGFVYKPTPKGGRRPKVNKVKTYKPTNVNVALDTGVADNGSMLRIDLYKVEGDGYYFVPVYASDMVEDKLPTKACVAHKDYENWKDMKEEDFLWSIYPNDLLLVKHKKGMTFTKVSEKADIEKEYSSKEELVYYIKAGIAGGNIKVITHDNSYEIKSLGIKTLESIEKYHVDVLGNIYKAPKEKRRK